jgi:hypothetical protein
LYRFVTDNAAALKDWRSCSGGCGRGVELGREVFKDLMESMLARMIGSILRKAVYKRREVVLWRGEMYLGALSKSMLSHVIPKQTKRNETGSSLVGVPVVRNWSLGTEEVVP